MSNDRRDLVSQIKNRALIYMEIYDVLCAEVGEKPGQLRSPSAIAVDQHQRIYVADTDNHRVCVFRSQVHREE